MLGTSVASAQGVECNSGDNPSLCYNGTKTNLTDLEFPVSGDTFTPNHKDSTNSIPIETLWFKFDGNSSATPTGAWNTAQKTYTISKTRGPGTYALDGKGKGMVIGANGGDSQSRF